MARKPTYEELKQRIRRLGERVAERDKSEESSEFGGHNERAGINRHRVGDERALHERISRSIMAPSHVRAAVRLHVKQLTGEA